MRKLMNAVMLSCRKATEVVEKKKHSRLDKLERIQLKMHLAVCRYCRNYVKQTGFIDRLLKRQPQFTDSTDTSTLENRIITDIQDKF